MKTQPATRESGSFEDLIFEGRNKSYGAFELTRKRNRYLFMAFIISFAGIATSIAVPFINALKYEPSVKFDDGSISVILAPVNRNNDVPLPPPPPKLDEISKTMISNLRPEVVEKADENFELMTNEDLFDKQENLPPPDLDQIPVGPVDNAIPREEYEEPIDFPAEQASFQGGDLNDFRKWVSEHISYPPEAAEAEIFGKVLIQFCVNKKGEVVEIKVLRGLHPVLDDATMKAISGSPKWVPAKQGGNPVKTRYVIPVVFDLL